MKTEVGTIIWPNGIKLIPVFCANCGDPGGHILESDRDTIENWAFYMCEPCAIKWQPMMGCYVEPDVAFWAKVRAVQMEQFGRELSMEEVAEALKNGDHVLSQLARERTLWRKRNEAVYDSM